MDLFSLLEWNGQALNDFLTEYPGEARAKVQTKAKRLRSNMVNRLVVMISEEVGISAWWMPKVMFDLYQKWGKNRGDVSSRKFLVDMYRYLTSQKMIRLISDLKSVFLLPPHYLPPDKMADLLQIHKSIQERYPDIYANQGKVGNITWDLDMNGYSTETQQCIKGIIYNLEISSDNVFYWIKRLCDPIHAYDGLTKKDPAPNLVNTKLVWNILNHLIDRNSKYEFVRPVILSLQSFHKKMTHKEKPIYLYHAVLLMVRRNEIDWSSRDPRVDTSIRTVNNIYLKHLRNGKMRVDDYVRDIHTRGGKRSAGDLNTFALEGALIKNENKAFLNKTYREIYKLFKQELDLYHSRGDNLS
jgi:hypothetical protein